MSDFVLSGKKGRAVLALCQASTVGDAASAAGLSRRQLQRYIHEDVNFQRALLQARVGFLRHGTARICGMVGRAIDVLGNALSGIDVDKNAFLSARFVIETALAIQEQDLDLRVSQLEERVRQGQYERQQQLDSRTDEGARWRRNRR